MIYSKKTILKILLLSLLIGQVQTAQAGWFDYAKSAGSWLKSTASSVIGYMSGQSQQVVDVARQNKDTLIGVGIFGGFGIAAVALALWRSTKKNGSVQNPVQGIQVDEYGLPEPEVPRDTEREDAKIKEIENLFEPARLFFSENYRKIKQNPELKELFDDNSQLILQKNKIVNGIRNGDDVSEQEKQLQTALQQLISKIDQFKNNKKDKDNKTDQAILGNDPDDEGPSDPNSKISQNPIQNPEPQKKDKGKEKVNKKPNSNPIVRTGMEFPMEPGDDVIRVPQEEPSCQVSSTGQSVGTNSSWNEDNFLSAPLSFELPIILHEELINQHLEQLKEKLNCEVDIERLKKDAKAFIAQGGKYFYYLTTGQINKLPCIREKFCDRENTQFDIERKGQLQAINSIMWFLYAEALSHGEQMWQGSFVLNNDKQTTDAFYNYLYSYLKAVNPQELQAEQKYTWNNFGVCRESSHLKQFKDHKSYGIDIDVHTLQGELISFLPNGQIHLLFKRLSDKRLFIKPEDHGLCATKVHGLLSHGTGFVKSVYRKACGSNVNEGWFKEHFPKDKQVDPHRTLLNLVQNQETKTISGLWKELQGKEDQNVLLANWRHVDKRFGNEIYFTGHDLSAAACYYAKSEEDTEEQKEVANYIQLHREAHRKLYELRKAVISGTKEVNKTKKEFIDLVHRFDTDFTQKWNSKAAQEIYGELIQQQIIFQKLVTSKDIDEIRQNIFTTDGEVTPLGILALRVLRKNKTELSLKAQNIRETYLQNRTIGQLQLT